MYAALRRPSMLLCCVGALLSSSTTHALDLYESYEAALSGDAEFQAARAAASAGREVLPMARAQLLPNISFSATRMKNDLTSETENFLGQTATTESQYPSSNYALTLRQPLYRPLLYAGYLQARARVDGVEAIFDKARQDVAVRVVGAYLNVLFAEEALRQTELQGTAIKSQLAAARRALEVGYGTRTDVDDAQARLDMNASRVLGARQQIDQARHELETLIDRQVGGLNGLDGRLFAPQPMMPDTLDVWIDRATAANPELRDLEARVEAARQEVERARAGHKPTLDLVVQRAISESDNITNPNARYDNTQLGIQLAVPLFAGGHVSAQVRQARAALEELELRRESLRRKLATQVRKEFQGVREGVLKVRALEQAERSADQSVLSNEKGVLAGTRSRLDILNAQEHRGNARLELARERMNYLMSRTRLLALCGALDNAAIVEMNRWFVR